MSINAILDVAQQMPVLKGHTVGFADTPAVFAAMTQALNKAGFSNARILVLHGAAEIPALERLLEGSSWGESAEKLLTQGRAELRRDHSVVCVEVQNAEQAATVAAVSTQCGVRSIYHFGAFVDTRLTP